MFKRKEKVKNKMCEWTIKFFSRVQMFSVKTSWMLDFVCTVPMYILLMMRWNEEIKSRIEQTSALRIYSLD